jgi:hypothetical protein
MDILKALDKLETLNTKLNSVNAIMMCPIVSEEVRIANLSLQYDLFMEFIGEYEDVNKYLSELKVEDSNRFEIYRFKKQLDKYWRSDVG